MKRPFVSFAVAAGLSTLALYAYPAIAGSKTSVSGLSQAAEDVVVRDVTTRDNLLSGMVVNQSRSQVRDVRLLIRYTWLWDNERHPGTDSPGRASFYTVTATIPPGGSAPFTYQSANPLPSRPGGHFKAEVEVAGFTEVGSAQGAAR